MAKLSTSPTRPSLRGAENATWRFKYVLPLQLRTLLGNPFERALWVAEQVQLLLASLQDFASAQKLVIETRAGSTCYPLSPPLDLPELQRLDVLLRGRPDIRRLDITLALCCSLLLEGGGTAPLVLSGEGVLSLGIGQDPSELFPCVPDAAWLDVGLETDIYAPFSLAYEADNRSLAAINGPRLSGFMRRLQAAMPLILQGVDPPELFERGLVDRYGYKLPHERSADVCKPLVEVTPPAQRGQARA